ncbi:hypothetical protein [Rhodopseudomonas sp.]|uniref:hypothetical protein n=1 Tax=Rhodopseudomonas sp. TaxID=1078 RepID=UPI0039E39CC7
MARKQFDNVRHMIPTPGTGEITFGSVPTTFRSFAAAGAIAGDQPGYTIQDGDAIEIGYLTLGAGALTATREVVYSSNSNNPLDLSGSAILECTPLASMINDDAVSFVREQSPTSVEKTRARSNLGMTTTGQALATAMNAADARDTIGATPAGSAILTAEDYAAVVSLLSAAIPSASNGYINRFRNAAMHVRQRGDSGTVAAGTSAYTIDGWIVGASGASIAWSASGSPYGASIAQRLTGQSGVTGAFIRQRIEGSVAAPLTNKQATVQFLVYNATGGAITPTLSAKYANSSDNFSAATSIVSSQALQSCPNGAWTTVAYTFAIGVNAANGVEVTLEFGSALNGAGKYVAVAMPDIRSTPGVSTGLNASPSVPELRPVFAEVTENQRYFWRTLTPITLYGYNSTSGALYQDLPFPVFMRIAPSYTMTFSGASSAVGNITAITAMSAQLYCQATAGGVFYITFAAGNEFSAEL